MMIRMKTDDELTGDKLNEMACDAATLIATEFPELPENEVAVLARFTAASAATMRALAIHDLQPSEAGLEYVFSECMRAALEG